MFSVHRDSRNLHAGADPARQGGFSASTVPHVPWYHDRALLLLLALAGAKLLLHCFANAFVAYGYFRDELYYLACADHPAAGYVDQPPFSIFVLAVWKFLFGDSLFALHLPAALAGAATVIVAGLIARELGGGVFAQSMAAIAAIASPISLGMDCVYSMNCFDILFWAWSSYVLLRLFKTEDVRFWLLLGLILGLGLLNKISVLWLGAGIGAGLLFSPHRRWLATRWPWLAGVIALLVFAPFVLWNIRHDFAHLEFIRNASAMKYGGLTPAGFLTEQLKQNNPVAVPLWIAGLVYFFLPANRRYRPLGIIYVVALLILVINGHSKAEYLSPAYAALFAGGSRWLEQSAGLLRRLRPAYAVVLLLSGLVLAPLAMPLLPVEKYVAYAAALGIQPGTPEGKQLAELPQFFADMFGWEEKAAAVAKAYNTLSPEEKTRCAIYADNYGRCAAIDFFGKKYGLPHAIGGHNNYWLWGPGTATGEIVIILGGDPEQNRREFETVTVADTASCAYCMPYENHLPVLICRKLKHPLNEIWGRVKHYI